LFADYCMAPEVYKDEIFDRSVDSYSFGVVLYEVVPYGFIRFGVILYPVPISYVNGQTLCSSAFLDGCI